MAPRLFGSNRLGNGRKTIAPHQRFDSLDGLARDPRSGKGHRAVKLDQAGPGTDPRPGVFCAGDAADADMKVWVRAESPLPDDERIHQAVLAYASDLTLLAVSTVPHPVEFAGPGMQVASIDHSMWFHRPARADQWLLYDQVSPSASAGLGFSFGRMFADGVLAASCAQEGLIRLTDPH